MMGRIQYVIDYETYESLQLGRLVTKCFLGNDESACGKLDAAIALSRLVVLLDKTFQTGLVLPPPKPGPDPSPESIRDMFVKDVDPDGGAARNLFISDKLSKTRLKATYVAAVGMQKALSKVVKNLDVEIQDIKSRM